MEAKICQLIAKALEVDSSSITIETLASEVENWDSLGHLTILMELESEFGGQIQENTKLASAVSVREIFDVVSASI